VFNSVAGHAQLVPGETTAASVHALRDVFYVTGLFALGALATIVFGVDRLARAEAPDEVTMTEDDDEFAAELSALAARDAEDESPLAGAGLSA
jgi:hypothetical protein